MTTHENYPLPLGYSEWVTPKKNLVSGTENVCLPCWHSSKHKYTSQNVDGWYPPPFKYPAEDVPCHKCGIMTGSGLQIWGDQS